MPGTFDLVFLDAWKPDYKKFFDLVFPRVTPGGLFLAHNVINKKNEMRDFLAAIATHPQALNTTVSPGHEGISMTYKKRDSVRHQATGANQTFTQCELNSRSPHHQISNESRLTSSACRSTSAAIVAAPTWGRRRFASPDSANSSPASGIRVVDKGDMPRRFPKPRAPGDPHKRYVKDIARVCQRLFQTSLASLAEGAMPIVLGGDHSLGAGSVAAAAAFHAQARARSSG